MLISLANDHADKCDDLVCEKKNYLMKEFRERLDVSEIGFLGPMLSVTSFFMHCSRTIVEDKKMDQLVKV